ncbi:PAS domain-containing protein [Dongia sp.]|uniref:PAS domain-containing protein n=1 Tax=Dongia sp. TaxID=1977262 RepID=UPI0035B09464
MMHEEITDAAELWSHPGFGRLLGYVDQKRGGNRWARRSDIDPCEIPGLLPHLWLIEVAEGSPRLLVRLAGTRVESVYGRSLTGIHLENLDWGPNSARIFASLHGMADTGRGHFLDVAAHVTPRLARRVQRLGLPLSEDQERVSHLLLVAFYAFTRGGQGSIGPEHFREFWLEDADTRRDRAGRIAPAALNEKP